MNTNEITYKIIGCAYKVHSSLGPGLLESAYEVCMMHELLKEGLRVEQQKPLPIIYEDIKLEGGYRIDLLVENKIVVEIKSVEAIAPIHKAQVLTYLKLSGSEIGLLLNFNVLDMKEGVNRLIISQPKIQV